MTTERLVTGALVALMIGFILIAIVAAALAPLESPPDVSVPPDHAASTQEAPPAPRAVSL